jgi:hypothetical protein
MCLSCCCLLPAGDSDDAGFEQQLAALAAGKTAGKASVPPPATAVGLAAADITPETMKVSSNATPSWRHGQGLGRTLLSLLSSTSRMLARSLWVCIGSAPVGWGTARLFIPSRYFLLMLYRYEALL